MASGSSSVSTNSTALEQIFELIAGEDDDNEITMLACDACKKPGVPGDEENYHEDPLGKVPGIKFAHFLPHVSCKKGWQESAIRNGTCSVCPGEANIQTLNGRRLSEIRKDLDEEKSGTTAKAKAASGVITPPTKK